MSGKGMLNFGFTRKRDNLTKDYILSLFKFV